MRLRRVTNCSIAAIAFLSISIVAWGQPKSAQFNHVTITLKTEGGPTMCRGDVRYCLPAYRVSLDENGTVKYFGIGGVKIEGKKTHSISPATVRDLVAEFIRIKFFSLENEYRYKRLPDGTWTGTDHSNATTISIDLDGKQKSVYIFYGAPDELMALKRRLFDALQIVDYVGRA